MIERRENERRNGYGRRGADDIHPRRWKALSVWIVLFTVAVAYALFQLHALYDDIQKSRRESITFQCRQQNERHDETHKQFLALIARASKGASPARRKQLQQSAVSTSLLIDALVPKQDCAALVNTLIQ